MSRCPNCDNSGFIRRPGNLTVKVDQVPQGEKVLLAKFIGKPPFGVAKTAVGVAPTLSVSAKPLAKEAPKNLVPSTSNSGSSSQPRLATNAPGKAPWPVIPIKPIIRPAVRRASRPQLQPAALVAAPSVAGAEEPTKMVVLKPEPEKIPVALVPPPEFTREILRTSDFELAERPAVTKTFEIPKTQTMIAVGHSVKGGRKKNREVQDAEITTTAPSMIPEALPDLPSPPPSSGAIIFLSEITTVVPVLAFLVISGIIGWNAVRYFHNGPDSDHHEIVDHLNSRAMAPVRGNRSPSKDFYPEKGSEKYNDDPTQLRSRSTEVQAYTGPGVDFSPTGFLQPGHLYSVLEKDGNWIKFALDKTHAAWVSIAGVDLIR